MKTLRGLLVILLLLTGCGYFDDHVQIWQRIDSDHDIHLVIDDIEQPLTIKIQERPLKGSVTGVQFMTVEVDGQRVSLEGRDWWQDNHPGAPGFVLEFKVDSASEIVISTASGVGLVAIEIMK